MNQGLFEILRCPVCVREKTGILTKYKEVWLICSDCDRKYPVVEDIPVMLITEGDKWRGFLLEDLPVPPPRPD